MVQVNDDLSNLIEVLDRNGGAKPAIVMGAGASFPYPTADKLRTDLATSLFYSINSSSKYAYKTLGNMDRDHYFCRELIGLCNSHYMTLENLFFVFEQFIDNFDETGFFQPDEIIKKFLSGYLSSPGNLTIASLRSKGVVGPIVTSNFDDLLVHSMNALGLPYRIKTSEQFSDPNYPDAMIITDFDVVPFHGTLVSKRIASADLATQFVSKYTSPDTLVARGLMRPFTPEMNDYLTSLFLSTIEDERPIVFYGYRGEDLYDLNMLLGSLKSKIDLTKLHWISYSPNQNRSTIDHLQLRDISQFAKSLNCNYWRGDFAADTQSVSGLNEIDDAILLNLEMRRDNGRIENMKKYTSNTEKLFEAVQGDADFQRGRDRLISRLLSGFTGAWAATEHYSLESYGFGQSEIQALGRPKKTNEALGVDVPTCIDFLGIDVGQFVDAQNSYWLEKENLKGKRHFADFEGADTYVRHLFENSNVAFLYLRSVVAEAASQLRNELPESVKEVEYGILCIFEVIALDYLGLMELSAALICGDEAREKLHRQRASDYFDNAGKIAVSVRRDLERNEDKFPNEKALKDMVPYLIWTVIVSENAARATDEKDTVQKISQLFDAAEIRENLIRTARENGLDAEATYMLPQAILRCTEAVKTFYACSRPDQVPTSINNKSGTYKMVQILLGKAQQFRAEYTSTSALRNRRTATVFDCEVIVAISESKFSEVPEIIDRLIEHYVNARGVNWLERKDIRGFVGGVLERLQKACDVYGDEYIISAAEKLKEALRSVAVR